jgi:hypothetical protein
VQRRHQKVRVARHMGVCQASGRAHGRLSADGCRGSSWWCRACWAACQEPQQLAPMLLGLGFQAPVSAGSCYLVAHRSHVCVVCVGVPLAAGG